MLRGLKGCSFNFNIENDPHLNAIPPWMVRMLQSANNAAPPTLPNGNKNTTASGGGARPPPPAAAQRTSSSGSTGSANGNSNATSGGGGGGGWKFDSFLKSFESSIDSVLLKVDAAADIASKFINDQLEQQQQHSQQGQNGGRGNGSNATSAGAGSGSGTAPLVAAVMNTLGAAGSAAATVASANTPAGAAGPARMVPFFGSPLKDLLLDERRTKHAYLNPLLGVPNQALKMINFLSNRAATPDLFRLPAAVNSVAALRRSVEEERGIPAGTEVAAVALLLVQWLNQLPEPLLGYEHYTAILACCELEDTDHRVRNLSLLVQESSWYAKPLLLRVITLLHKCVQQEYATQNNLNIIAVSVLSTPFVLRPFVAALHVTQHTFYQDSEAKERMQMAATAAGSTTVEFLITHCGRILQRIREEYAQREAVLAAKCARISALQESVAEGVETMYVGYIDEDRQAMIRELWELLALPEEILYPPASTAVTPSSSTADIASAAGGGDGGVNGKENPLEGASSAVNMAAFLDEGDEGEMQEEEPGSNRSGSASTPTTPTPPIVAAITGAADAKNQLSIADILAHPRWERCGFLPAELPLGEFAAQYGYLALQSLLGFMRR